MAYVYGTTTTDARMYDRVLGGLIAPNWYVDETTDSTVLRTTTDGTIATTIELDSDTITLRGETLENRIKREINDLMFEAGIPMQDLIKLYKKYPLEMTKAIKMMEDSEKCQDMNS